MADCDLQPGLYVVTNGRELPLCITHDRPFKSSRAAHGLPGECPAAGQPAKKPSYRKDAYLSEFPPEVWRDA